MNLNKTDSNASIDEAASLWAARIEGSTLSAADRDALDAWLAQNPAHRAALSQYCQFSADLEQQIPALVAAGLVELPAAGNSRSGTRQSFGRARALRNWLTAGALAAAALVVGFRLISPEPPSAIVQGPEFATAAGEQKTVTLADGSTVEMNAQTRFRFLNTPGERRVHLTSGEAFFTVAKLTPAVPFLVESAAGTIRVTGTRFSVRAYSDSELEVTVEEGSVEVAPGSAGSPSAAHSLMANDQLLVHAGVVTQSTLSAEDLVRALSWRQGIAHFRGERLADAAKRFEQFNGFEIHVDRNVAGIRVEARHSLKDFAGFVRDSGPLLGFRATRGLDGSFTLESL